MIAATIARKLFSFLTIMLMAMFAAESAQAQEVDDLRKEVLDAWQRRQDSVQSATFKIRSTLVITKEELLNIEDRHQTLHGMEPNPKEVPSGDKILTELYEVAFDGDKTRYFMTFDKSTHDIAKSVNRNMTLLHVTNGADYRCLDTFPDHGFKSGIIQNAGQFLVFRNEDIKPILLAFRAFSKHLPEFTNELEIVKGEHQIGDRPVIVMQQRHKGVTSGGVQYWIDSSREYVVLRMLGMSGDGRVGTQTDIEYKQDEADHWVPIKWVRSDFDSEGVLRRSYEFKVVDFEINSKLPESLFELEFEPGVEVFDKRKGVNRANIWTVSKDGTKAITRGVDPDKSEEFPESRRMLLWASGIILLLLVIFFGLRRKHAPS